MLRKFRGLSLAHFFIVIFALLMLWVSVLEIDQSVRGQGQIVSLSKTQVIQAQDSGIVDEILVREGDEVMKGETLAILEKEKATASYNIALYDVSSSKQIYQSINEEYALNKKLYKSGDIGYLELVRIERQLIEAKSKYEVAIQKLNEQKFNLEKMIVLSPIDGVVKYLKINTVGAYLRQGDEVMHIAPSNEEYVFEVKVSPTDVAGLRNGLEALVKLDAYDYSIYGAIKGRVIYVGPDTLTEMASSEQKFPYYRVHIAIPADRSDGSSQQQIDLKLGLTGSVDIIVGQRTVLQYLLKPVYKGLSGALSER